MQPEGTLSDATKRSSRVRQPPKWLRGATASAADPAAAPAAAPDSSGEGSGGSVVTQATPTPHLSPGATNATFPERQPYPAAVLAAAPGITDSTSADAAANITDNAGRSPTSSSGQKRRRADRGSPSSGDVGAAGSTDAPKRGKRSNRAAPAAARGPASRSPASRGPAAYGPAQPESRWQPGDPARFVKRESYFYCHFSHASDPRTPAQAEADEAAFLHVLRC